MFRFAMLTAVTAAALMTAGFQSAPPQLTPALAALAEDAGAARAFDYMALKAEGVDVKAMSDAVYRRTVVADSDPRCLTEAEAEVQMGLAAAAEAADRAAFDDDRAAAADAWAKWTLFAEGLEHGGASAEVHPCRVSVIVPQELSQSFGDGVVGIIAEVIWRIGVEGPPYLKKGRFELVEDRPIVRVRLDHVEHGVGNFVHGRLPLLVREQRRIDPPLQRGKICPHIGGRVRRFSKGIELAPTAPSMTRRSATAGRRAGRAPGGRRPPARRR